VPPGAAEGPLTARDPASCADSASVEGGATTGSCRAAMGASPVRVEAVAGRGEENGGEGGAELSGRKAG
jgi:hypothetical protein